MNIQNDKLLNAARRSPNVLIAAIAAFLCSAAANTDAAPLQTWDMNIAPLSASASDEPAQKKLTLVGNDPRRADLSTTTIKVNIVPIILDVDSVELGGAAVRITRDPTRAFSGTQTALSQVLKSPIFSDTQWTVDPALGRGQVIDAFMKRSFGAWLRNAGRSDEAYLKLQPVVQPAVRLSAVWAGSTNPVTGVPEYEGAHTNFSYEEPSSPSNRITVLNYEGMVEKFTQIIRNDSRLKPDSLTLFLLFDTHNSAPLTARRSYSLEVASEGFFMTHQAPYLAAYTVKGGEKYSYVVASYNRPLPDIYGAFSLYGKARGNGEDISPIVAGLAQWAVNPYSQLVTRNKTFEGDPVTSLWQADTRAEARGNSTYCKQLSHSQFRYSFVPGVNDLGPISYLDTGLPGLFQDVRVQTHQGFSWTIPNLITPDWWTFGRASANPARLLTFFPYPRGHRSATGTRIADQPCQILPALL